MNNKSMGLPHTLFFIHNNLLQFINNSVKRENMMLYDRNEIKKILY